MIDRLSRIAESLRVVRTPSLIVALACFATIVFLLLVADSPELDRFLMPTFIGLLWAIGLYSFVEAFRGVPETGDSAQGILHRLGRSIRRGGYWVLSMLFVGATLLALYLTVRLLSIWLGENGA